jgi:hypothetical protein
VLFAFRGLLGRDGLAAPLATPAGGEFLVRIAGEEAGDGEASVEEPGPERSTPMVALKASTLVLNSATAVSWSAR